MKTVAELLKAKPARRVVSVRPEQSVLEAIKVLAAEDIGAAVVMTGERLAGIFSERDYTRKVALKGKSSKQTPVKEILSGQVIRVSPAHSVEDCMRLMTDHRVRHLPVSDGDNILGIISIGDLVNWIISAQTTTIHQLQTYISGYPG